MALDFSLIQHFSQQENGLAILMSASGIVGAVVVYIFRARKIKALAAENAALVMKLSLEKQANEQFDAILDQTHVQLANTFNQLSNEALTRNNEHFLKLAEENLKRYQSEAKAELHSKEQAIEQLVKPINDALLQTAKQIHDIEKERKESYGNLSSTISQMALGQQALQSETQNLVQALRRPEVRGQWGEMTLRRLAELSGMVAHCDFFEQTHTVTETGSIRPDMIVRLPENREIIVDAKTPLDAYLSAIQTTDDEVRKKELKRHAQIIRQRAKELAAKNYWAEFAQSPEFVILFIPGEHFLSAALEVDPSLLEDTIKNNIILASPTNFIALLRAVSYGWKLGASLNSSVDNFNKTVCSFERQVIPSGKRFVDMGIRTKEEISSISTIEKQVRDVKVDDNDD